MFELMDAHSQSAVIKVIGVGGGGGNAVSHMVDTGFINTIREIWWDVRPHNNFGTVEVRVCDMPGRMTDVLALTAFIQCLVKSLSDQIDDGQYQHDCHPMMVRQNKWRAARYGIAARLVHAQDYRVRSVDEIACDLVERLRDIAVDLGCEAELLFVKEISAGHSWADRQRQIIDQTGQASEIVRQLSSQSRITDVGTIRS